MLKYYLYKLIKKLHLKGIKNSTLDNSAKVEAGSLVYSSSIGKHSFCGYDCEINSCDIGSYTSIGNNVKVGGGFHPISWVGMSPVFYSGKDSVKKKLSRHNRRPALRTIIGSDVWIGQNVLIKEGVTIGSGAVIGMGSVVTKDVPSYAIYAGNPARLIRYRFDSDTVERLVELKWWEKDEDTLQDAAKYVKDVNKFIKSLEI